MRKVLSLITDAFTSLPNEQQREVNALAAMALRHNVDQAVAHVFRVECRTLHQTTRGRAPIAYARQVAMYLAHVAGGCTLSQVGRLYGRDRTTVAHACALIEDDRDDTRLDLALHSLECAVRQRLPLLAPQFPSVVGKNDAGPSTSTTSARSI